jgi:hypothetical protein
MGPTVLVLTWGGVCGSSVGYWEISVFELCCEVEERCCVWFMTPVLIVAHAQQRRPLLRIKVFQIALLRTNSACHTEVISYEPFYAEEYPQTFAAYRIRGSAWRTFKFSFILPILFRRRIFTYMLTASLFDMKWKFNTDNRMWKEQKRTK